MSDLTNADLLFCAPCRKAGRTSPDQITLFDSTGTGLQDVAAAAFLYARTSGVTGLRSIAMAAA